MNLKRIEGEEVVKMHFLSNDVLQNETQKTERKQKLINGMILGNLERQKSHIAFHAIEGDGYIESVIFAVTDKYICLKGGITLLIASIIEVWV